MNDEANGHDPNAPRHTRYATIIPSVPPAAPADRAAVLAAELRASTWSQCGAKLVERVLARVDGNEKPVPTPWQGINDTMGGGLWPGMYVVVGGTGTGKSQWALQTALHAAMGPKRDGVGGVPALLLSLELDALGVFARAASFVRRDLDGNNLARVPWSALYTGGHDRDRSKREALQDSIKANVAPSLDVLSKLPVHWREASPFGFSHDELRPVVEAFRTLYPRDAHPVVTVVVDFLQLVAGGLRPDGTADPREDSVTRVSRASYQCRAIARDLGAVVLVLSSTARENAKAIVAHGDTLRRVRAGENDSKGAPVRKPYLGELVGLGKESGDVEFSADGVLTLVQEPVDDATLTRGGRPVHVAVAKLRAGVPDWRELRFDGTRFVEPPESPPDGHVWCHVCETFVVKQPKCGECKAQLAPVSAKAGGR